MSSSDWVAIAVAVAASIFSFLMWRRAGTANRHAEASSEAARRSAEEAARSSDIAERVEQRQIERHDVVWGLEWDRTKKVLKMRNKGSDDAEKVVFVVDFLGGSRVEEAGTIPSLVSYDFDLLESWVDLSQSLRAANNGLPVMPLRVPFQRPCDLGVPSWHSVFAHV
ncbi:hypothetical protein KIH31_08445 [Paenarthrobacter sp. DKR-5]|uniref:hypothetical protein n=1 Tax=Paenarthrobacter sp. DKR-5 TaxID=2835535 RepID=UPI001BDD0E48|nr:hypothetical protein [Paenarthrobacter sp. DKR-5]MBT1002630.1 hypothetical protein [Paenarthrobacter sp. DKR-5]